MSAEDAKKEQRRKLVQQALSDTILGCKTDDEFEPVVISIQSGMVQLASLGDTRAVKFMARFADRLKELGVNTPPNVQRIIDKYKEAPKT